MQSFKALTILMVLVLLRVVVLDGANILALMGVASPSHYIWNSVLLHALAQRGHNVTVLSANLPRKHEKLPANVHYIHLERTYDIYKSVDAQEKVDISDAIGLNAFSTIPLVYDFGLKTIGLVMKSRGLQQLLAYPGDFHFDLIINDYTMGPFLLGFAHHFRYPPIVGVSAFHNPPITIDFMSNHYFPAYTPYYLTVYSKRMSFWQRLLNTLVFMADTLYRRLYYTPRIDEIVRPYFDDQMPPVSHLAQLTAISMVNSHPAIDFVEPLPPNVIEIGGMQIGEPQPLPDELEQFVSGGRKGALFFSLGTNVKSGDMSPQKIHIILQAIANLTEYNFLWKFDEDYLRDYALPANVLVKSFFPQRDILAHPQLKAFITHCGGMSSQEATWRAVPMVGMPLFLDQHRNLLQSMLAGCARKVDYLTMTAESLAATIQHVAEDTQMLLNVQRRSRLFRDNAIQPLEKAIWWIEYLLREPQPAHLRSPAAELNFFQAHSFDVLFFLGLPVCLVAWMLLKTILCGLSFVHKLQRQSRNQHSKND